MSYTFHPAAAADIPELNALVEAGYRGDSARRGWTHESDLLGGQRTDQDALAALIADPANTILLARHGDVLNGCVQVTDKGARDERRIAYLGMLTVDPSLQGGGLGRRLIEAAEDHARVHFRSDIMEMTVITLRRELIDWYVRRGYADTGRREPFPLDDARFGLPKRRDLEFTVLAKPLR